MARLPMLARRSEPGRIPWQVMITIAAEVVNVGRERWNRLTKREQQEVLRILRKSRGRRGNVTAREQSELQRLVWKAVGPRR
ncbi:MAG: hypothetical protein ACJ76S_02360 [Solirubrobacteraceae bacterium]